MNNQSFKWESLSVNDSVDIIAPASASSEERLEDGLRWLRNLDLIPRLPDRLIQTDLFFAGPLEQQWTHLKEALYSDAKVIWCLRGGYGSMRLIPLLEKLAQPPKIKLLIGFSDITALHLFFNQRWNWPSLHGRTISQLRSSWEQSQEQNDLIDLLFGRIQSVSFDQLVPLNAAARETKTLKGSIIGGNLRLIQSSLGTSWQIQPKGKMLFIEDVSERGYSVDRMLEQLYQANILNQDIKALLIGDFTEGLEKDGQNLVPEALRRFAQRVPYPVVSGLPCGHSKEHNAALPFNTPVTLQLGLSAKLTCQTHSK